MVKADSPVVVSLTSFLAAQAEKYELSQKLAPTLIKPDQLIIVVHGFANVL